MVFRSLHSDRKDSSGLSTASVIDRKHRFGLVSVLVVCATVFVVVLSTIEHDSGSVSTAANYWFSGLTNHTSTTTKATNDADWLTFPKHYVKNLHEDNSNIQNIDPLLAGSPEKDNVMADATVRASIENHKEENDLPSSLYDPEVVP